MLPLKNQSGHIKTIPQLLQYIFYAPRGFLLCLATEYLLRLKNCLFLLIQLWKPCSRFTGMQKGHGEVSEGPD